MKFATKPVIVALSVTLAESNYVAEPFVSVLHLKIVIPFQFHCK